MTVPTTMADLSTTASSNSPSGSDLKSQGDDNIRVGFAILRGLSFKGSDITSASSLSLGSAFGSVFKVTGTTTVTGISSTGSWAGRRVEFWHTGTQSWTHSSTLYFPDAVSHTFLSGDKSAWEDMDGAGTWHCVGIYQSVLGLTTLAGNLVFSGDSRRLTGQFDFSNSDVGTQIKTSATNSATFVPILPSGSGDGASIGLYAASSAADATYLQLNCNSTTSEVISNASGAASGSQPPLDLGSGSAQWRIDTSGRWLNSGSTQPAFRATRSSSAQTSGSTCIFNSTSVNRGSSYNTSTGVFTAPVTGLYMFSMFMVLSNTTGSTLNLSPVIQTGASLTLTGNDRDLPTGSTVKHAGSCLAFLTAADTVSCTPGTFSAQFTLGTGSTFCGALIC